MQERRRISDIQVNRDLLRGVFVTPRWFWIAVLGLGLIVVAALTGFGIMTQTGLGITGLSRPNMWGFFLTNFVFWIGISHAGIMISAILRLSQAEWRRPVTRAAEVLTVFSLLTALTMVIVHLGRPWRAYWIFPYDFPRGVWPNVRSPLIWDPAAIGTYLTGSSLFIYVALLPDMAVLRDRTRGWLHGFYSMLCLGWRGTPRQWRLQALAGILLSALILPVFVSVHSIVSWDFAVNMSVEGWHATIFAPYFVIGAIHSGVSGVVTIMALLRWLFRWDDYIRPEHFDAIGRLLIVVATTWFFFFFVEFSMGLFSQEPQEIALREMQVFTWPWSGLFAVFIITAFFIPVPLWLFKKVRRNIPLMFATSISVNVGMWMERFLIIAPGLARKQPLVFDWGTYKAALVEWTIIIASFCLVLLLMLLFSKVFPLIPLFDEKEGQRLRDEVRVVKKEVPAVIHE